MVALGHATAIIIPSSIPGVPTARGRVFVAVIPTPVPAAPRTASRILSSPPLPVVVLPTPIEAPMMVHGSPHSHCVCKFQLRFSPSFDFGDFILSPVLPTSESHCRLSQQLSDLFNFRFWSEIEHLRTPIGSHGR